MSARTACSPLCARDGGCSACRRSFALCPVAAPFGNRACASVPSNITLLPLPSPSPCPRGMSPMMGMPPMMGFLPIVSPMAMPYMGVARPGMGRMPPGVTPVRTVVPTPLTLPTDMRTVWTPSPRLAPTDRSTPAPTPVAVTGQKRTREKNIVVSDAVDMSKCMVCQHELGHRKMLLFLHGVPDVSELTRLDWTELGSDLHVCSERCRAKVAQKRSRSQELILKLVRLHAQHQADKEAGFQFKLNQPVSTPRITNPGTTCAHACVGASARVGRGGGWGGAGASLRACACVCACARVRARLYMSECVRVRARACAHSPHTLTRAHHTTTRSQVTTCRGGTTQWWSRAS